jgi:sigma-E factor negative regulatory protein RseB
MMHLRMALAKARLCACVVLMCVFSSHTWADNPSVSTWLLRLHEASRNRAYMGTFVVTTNTRTTSAKIWHVCDGDQQVQRIESLSGAPRSTYRKNSEVLTLYPLVKQGVAETRDSFSAFPALLKSQNTSLDDFYQLKSLASERIAGVEADVVQILPKDGARYGYRVWSEKKSGLLVQLQTLDVDGKTLEQSAFSELQLDAPVSAAQLIQQMGQTDGYRLERPILLPTTADAQGWVMTALAPGFRAAGCYARSTPSWKDANGKENATMQWIFTDGLATVSMFVERYDPARHLQTGTHLRGATRTHTRKLGAWWITGVGEVPAAILSVFVDALERKK